jgi:hypothetical protein
MILIKNFYAFILNVSDSGLQCNKHNEHGTLYNYADDNTLSYADQDYNTLINVLEKESSILIEWFNFNCMQANPVL